MDDEEYQNITKKEELIQKLSEFPPRDRDGNEVEAILTKCILIMEWTDVEGNAATSAEFRSTAADRATESPKAKDVLPDLVTR